MIKEDYIKREQNYTPAEKTRKSYEKPKIELVTNMTFMFEGINKEDSKQACRQCFSCHGCR